MSSFLRNITITLQRWEGSRYPHLPVSDEDPFGDTLADHGAVLGQMFYYKPYPTAAIDITRFVRNKPEIVEEMKYGLFDYSTSPIDLEFDDPGGAGTEFIRRPWFYSDPGQKDYDEIYLVTITRGSRTFRRFFRYEDKDTDIKFGRIRVKAQGLLALLDDTFEDHLMKDYPGSDSLPDGAWNIDEMLDYIQAKRPKFDPTVFGPGQNLTYEPAEDWWVAEEKIGNYLDVISLKCRTFGIRASEEPQANYGVLSTAWNWYFPAQTKLNIYEISSGEEKLFATLDIPKPHRLKSNKTKDEAGDWAGGYETSFINGIRFALQNISTDNSFLWLWTQGTRFEEITIWRVSIQTGGSWAPVDPFNPVDADEPGFGAVPVFTNNIDNQFVRVFNDRPYVHLYGTGGTSSRVPSWPGDHGDYRNIGTGSVVRNAPSSLSGDTGTSVGTIIHDCPEILTDVKDAQTDSDRVWAVGIERWFGMDWGSVRFVSDRYDQYSNLSSSNDVYDVRVGFPWDVYYARSLEPLFVEGKKYSTAGTYIGTETVRVPNGARESRFIWYRRARMWMSGICLDKYAGSMVELLIDMAAGANCDLRLDDNNNLLFVRRDYSAREWTLPDRVKLSMDIEGYSPSDGDVPELSRIELPEATKKRIQTWYRRQYINSIENRVNIEIALAFMDSDFPVPGDQINETIEGKAVGLIVQRSGYNPDKETVKIETINMG